MADDVVVLEGTTVTRSGVNILDDVTLKIGPREHWVLLGPNGAGKTTVAKLISGREYPSAGTVTVLGQDTSETESTYLASRVGFASAHVRDRFIPTDSVVSLVLAAGWGQTAKYSEEYGEEDDSRARDLLTALGIGDLADRAFGTLSEGERQRVSIARALMADPEIVILDEPTAGLDLGARETLVLALTDIMADPTTPSVLLITHEIEEIAPGFTHVALLRDGKVLEAGPIESVLTGAKLSETFGMELEVERQGNRWWAHASER